MILNVPCEKSLYPRDIISAIDISQKISLSGIEEKKSEAVERERERVESIREGVRKGMKILPLSHPEEAKEIIY